MVARQKIYLSPPDVGEAEEIALIRAIRSGWVAPLGPEVDAFEQELRDYLGVNHAVALSSGTAALHLGLLALGVSPGDSVIMPTMTFVATANSAMYAGANPVFVDSERDGTISVRHLEEALRKLRYGGSRVGAVVPVDVYGRPVNYSEVIRIAGEYEVPVLVDSAESLGSEYQGSLVGGLGNAAVFSFNGNKVMTTSGGGVFVSSDDRLAKIVRHLASQARENTIHYEHRNLGFNYRMSNILAALGRAQLGRLPSMIERRRVIRRRYTSFFSQIKGIDMLEGDDISDNCWLSAIIVDSKMLGKSREALRRHLADAQIESRPLWKPMHLQPLYRDAPYFGEKRAEQLFEGGLALPSGSSLSDSDMDFILVTIANFVSSR